MSYFHSGRGRNSSRSCNRGPRRQAPAPQYIDPSRYISQAVVPDESIDSPVKITHSFADFGLDSRLVTNVQRHGYALPTEIQDKAIPVIMLERDLVGIANTGTGKTAAFLLPLIHKVLNQLSEGVLILAPTRELALQIADEYRAFARALPLSMTVCVGGTNILSDIRAIEKNPHFVIATPGRLKDLQQRGAFNPLKYANVVLDEVDRMLDIGFLKDIHTLIELLPQPRSSYFFSATMNKQVETVMRSFLRDPIRVTIRPQVAQGQIEQNIVRIQPGDNKVDLLCNLLKQPEFERVIVFGRTKRGVNTLERILSERGLLVCSIHGNKNQNARQRALDSFKRGRATALLATDVAARGIDVPNVTHVINYDEPSTYEDYTHRIGRTGRAGKVGKALTFVM